MKICIDGLGISRLPGTGLYSYTYNLLDSLLKIYPQPQYKLLWEGSSCIEGWERYGNLSYENLTLSRNHNDYSSLEEYLSNNKIQLYHSPNNGLSLPQNKVSGYIITVHDMFPLRYEKYTDIKYLEKFKAVFPENIKKCDRIIAVSNFVKNEILKYYDIPEGSIKVVYPGCPSSFYPRSPEESRRIIKEKYGIEGDFVLYAGSIHVRKNLHLLMKSFKKVLEQENGLKLVIAGKIDGKRQQYFLKLKRLAEDLGIADSVIFTGAVGYEDMPWLYNASKCSVNLSIYEGFPIASIEAMACGTPAICMRSSSDEASSFEEVLGSAVSYINPGDEDGLKDLILKIINDKAYREEMIEKAMAQSKKFNAEASAKNIVSIYESI